ncbi:hypothetical protein, partial [Thiolapillus sp.]|uniref:hypothetical protein n=1 Tax=Thiolapillus sp. TaxID=2017437 RepID=UPI003AF41840
MFSLWRKARRENSAASRLLGSTSLRFALHGWQRMMNLAPRRLLRGAKRQGIIDHPVNDFLLHDLQYQSDKLS